MEKQINNSISAKNYSIASSTNYTLELYNHVNYEQVDAPVVFGVFVRTLTSLAPITTLAPTFSATFNDLTVSNSICAFTDHIFEYTYKAPYKTAAITISASLPVVDLPNAIFTQTFFPIRIDPIKETIAESVNRISPDSTLTLPWPSLYVPTNEWAIAESYNTLIDKLYDNFDFVKNACKAYKPAPTKFIGTGQIINYNPNACYTSSIIPMTSTNIYGVIGDTKDFIIFSKLPETNITRTGTSLFNVISTISTSQISVTGNTGKALISNLPNLGVPLLSSNNINLQTIIYSPTAIPFSHTVIDYITNQTPTLHYYLAVQNCNDRFLIPVYRFTSIVLPRSRSYTTKTIDWKLQGQFNEATSLNIQKTFTPSLDITTQKSSFYVTRSSFIEKYNLNDPLSEMIYTTESIDIGESISIAKSVAVSEQERVYLLDNRRHVVKIFDVNPVSKKIQSISQWGSLGGKNDKQGFNRPTQIFIDNEQVYVCDSGNNCVKKYSLQGNWKQTFLDVMPSGELPVTACVDKDSNLHVVSTNSISKISPSGKLIQNTPIVFPEPNKPVKMVTSYDKKLLYICTNTNVYRLTLNHEITNIFAELDKTTYPGLENYNSIATDNNGTIYITDGNVIFKYLDIPEVFKLRSEAANSLFWTREQIHIQPSEMVNEWVYNRSLRRLAENIEILFRTIEYKIIPASTDRKQFNLSPINGDDVGLFQGLPTSVNDLPIIGMNEIVTPEVINRTLDLIQDNLHFVLKVILNQVTVDKLGLEVNFISNPVVLPDICWDWESRTQDAFCTKWTSLTRNTTWEHAKNLNNVVVLSGDGFTVSQRNTEKLNTITDHFTVSFWISSQAFANPGSFNMLGYDVVNQANPGFRILGQNGAIRANINGTFLDTANTVINQTRSDWTHIVFSKYQVGNTQTCAFYINGTQTNLYNSNIPLFVRQTVLNTNLSQNTSDLAYKLRPFNIGFRHTLSTTSPWIGAIKDIWIFKDVVPFISQSDVQLLYTRPKYWELTNSLRSKLIVYWPLNSTNIALDYLDRTIGEPTGGRMYTINNLWGPCCDN